MRQREPDPVTVSPSHVVVVGERMALFLVDAGVPLEIADRFSFGVPWVAVPKWRITDLLRAPRRIDQSFGVVATV